MTAHRSSRLLTLMTAILAGLTLWVSAIPAQTFNGLASGPYRRLVIRNAMVIPGHGGPANGPYDILIENNTITQMVPFDPVSAERRGEGSRMTGDRIIDATGKYVMPGMIDLHMHLRTQPMEIDYVYFLKLAHGVTTMVPAPDRGLDSALVHQKASAENRILSPRQYPIWGWGRGFSREEFENPAQAPRIARAMVAEGAHVVSVGNVTWNQELFGAVCKAVWDAGGITTIHLPPSTTAVVNAVDAARLGVTMIEHHYGYAESSLPRSTQDYPRDYNFDNENHRFREAGRVWVEAKQTSRDLLLTQVADSLVKYGVAMLPTRVVYEANRDILRAQSLPWHEKYTHQALINWNLPNPAFHGSYHYDWTSDDESYWTDAFRLWGDLIYEFNKRGGRVAYGTDDNYIWATPGFSNVRELQLLRETGMHNLEVIKAATLNSALTLRQPKLGLVRPGYLADLLIVDGNPAYNLRFMYSFGALTLDADKKMIRTNGIVHTIKDGVVIENAKLMTEVEKMVARSKAGLPATNAVTAPFVGRAR
ncbi:MAG: amidohydrolase family protein [Gemmatimonadota bacterium]